MSFHLKDLQHIPHQPGVYLFKNNKDQVLYIGKAKDLRKRISQYFSASSVWKIDMLARAVDVEYLTVGSESEALFLEDNLIKKHQPEFNRLLKADNSYGYIKITSDPYPQIYFTRKRVNDGAHYIGPKTFRQELKKLLQYLRQFLKWRGCKTTQFRAGKLCGDYFFGLCKGRCVFAQLGTSKQAQALLHAKQFNLPISGDSQFYIQESKKSIHALIDFFRGETKELFHLINSEIQNCIVTENFEYAAQLRDIYRHVDLFVEKQHVVVDLSVTGKLWKMKRAGDRILAVMCDFVQGKLIDVIRFQYPIADMNMLELLMSCEREWGSSHWYFGHKLTRIDKTTLSDSLTFFEDLTEVFCVVDSIKSSRTFVRESEQLCSGFMDSYFTGSLMQDSDELNNVLSHLQNRYLLSQFPYRVECLDISHLSGGWTSAGLSCMIGGVSAKHGYRKYKIKNNKKSDDLAAMREVLLRRFKTTDDLPDLFILDGSKTQLGVIKELLQKERKQESRTEYVQFAALGKGKARERKGKNSGELEELLVLNRETRQISTSKFQYDQIDQLLIKLRDEAHRFANQYRKKQMSKEFSLSQKR